MDALSLTEYTLLAASSLFVILDPIAVVPTFLAMTSTDSPAQRLRMARIACLTAGGVMMVFAITGNWIFSLLGISIPAFQMAGSILLLLVALDLLRGHRSSVQESEEEKEAGAAKDDIAITPLAVPMLAGPGAISTVILLHSQAKGMSQQVALMFCIAAVALASYVVFALSTHGARWLTPIVLRLLQRLMGLLLAAIAMQFLINALRALKFIP